jgi:hypothetical protein
VGTASTSHAFQECSWSTDKIPFGFQCFDNWDKGDAAIVYKDHHKQNIRRQCNKHSDWAALQINGIGFISVHFPCCNGVVNTDRMEDCQNRIRFHNIIDDITLLMNSWQISDHKNLTPAVTHWIIGMDANTKLLPGVEGITGDGICGPGRWDDKTEALYNWLGRFNLRAANTFWDDGKPERHLTWANKQDASTQIDFLCCSQNVVGDANSLWPPLVDPPDHACVLGDFSFPGTALRRAPYKPTLKGWQPNSLEPQSFCFVGPAMRYGMGLLVPGI